MVLDFLKSPAEISTLFLVLTIGFYVFLFWRSQINAQERSLPRRSTYRRRISDHSAGEPVSLHQMFEDDGDKDQATTH